MFKMTIRQLVEGYVEGKEQYEHLRRIMVSQDSSITEITDLVSSLKENPAQEFLRRDYPDFDGIVNLEKGELYIKRYSKVQKR